MERNYIGMLQETMVKYGITPTYEVVENKNGTHINSFKIRLSCRLPHGGPICTVYGEGLSKRTAKRSAASIFMENYLKENNNDDSFENQSQKQHACVINVNLLNRTMLLQMICTKNNLEKPEFSDVLQAGAPHSPKFTMACKVGYLRTEGEGSRKNDAKLAATTKMIQLLMKAQGIYEIFEAAQSESLVMSNEIVCLADGLTGSRCPNRICIFGRRRLRNESPKRSQEIVAKEPTGNIAVLYSDFKSPDTSVTVSLNFSKTTDKTEQKVVKSLDNSISDLTPMKLEDDSKGHLVHVKAKSKSLGNLSKCVSDEGNKSSTTPDTSLMKAAYLETMNKINKVLENAEDQLYKAILDTLEQRDKAQKKVCVLSNEFDVYINHDRPIKILCGDEECTDESIRIACLTKVLLELKQHIKNTLKVLEKPGKLDRCGLSL